MRFGDSILTSPIQIGRLGIARHLKIAEMSFPAVIQDYDQSDHLGLLAHFFELKTKRPFRA